MHLIFVTFYANCFFGTKILNDRKICIDRKSRKVFFSQDMFYTCSSYESICISHQMILYRSTEPKKKLPLCLRADIHKYENQD